METAEAKLRALIDWVRDKLERLHREVEDCFVRDNLHALIRACDPETNPRLRGAVAELERQGESRTWTLRRIPRAANRMLRAHWSLRSRERRAWRREVRAVCGRPREPVHGRVRLEITVHRRALHDPDNAVASVKHLLDALVGEGWLRDDSREYLDLRVSEVVEPERGRRRTVLRWMAVEPGEGGFKNGVSA